MGYRILIFNTLYPGLEQQFLSTHPEWPNWNYKEFHFKLTQSEYVFTSHFSAHLNRLGNDAWEYYPSFRPLQLSWAREHGLPLTSKTWMRDVVVEQVRCFQPEVLFLLDLFWFDLPLRKAIRDACRHPVLIIGWRAAPTTDFKVFRDVDLMVTAAPHFVPTFEASGVRSMFLPHGFASEALGRLPAPRERDKRFTFVGKVGTRHGHHSKRYRLIRRLMEETPLEVWSDNDSQPGNRYVNRMIYQANRVLRGVGIPASVLTRIPFVRRGVGWVEDPTEPSIAQRFPSRFHREIHGHRYLELLGRSQVTFNVHIDVAANFAGNMRLFEATGMGACLVTDWKENLHEFFELDREVIVYKSTEECVEKVLYLLDHDDERQKVARAGRERTLRDHGIEHRMERLDEEVRRLLHLL